MIKVLQQAGDIVSKKWGSTRGGWKVALVAGCIVLSLLGIIGLVLWMLVRLVKALTIGGTRNKNLYIPSMGTRRR